MKEVRNRPYCWICWGKSGARVVDRPCGLGSSSTSFLTSVEHISIFRSFFTGACYFSLTPCPSSLICPHPFRESMRNNQLWIRRYQVYLGQEDRALRVTFAIVAADHLLDKGYKSNSILLEAQIDNKGLEIRYLYHEIVFQAFLYVFSMLNLLPSFCILEGIGLNFLIHAL